MGNENSDLGHRPGGVRLFMGIPVAPVMPPCQEGGHTSTPRAGEPPTADAQRWPSEGFPHGGEARSDSLLHRSTSNNSIEEASEKLRTEQVLALCGILAPYQKRQAHTLFANVSRLIHLAPSVGHVGFFTLTTKDIADKEEFSRRWNSMRSNYWNDSPHFGHWLGCFEQQKRGAWHLHLLVTLPYDIRQGVNFAEFKQRRYKSASPYLRSVWRDLRGSCLRYGFGRHELLPVRSDAETMAQYVGKYISKHIGQREEAAKGKRLITSSQGWLKNSVHFAWNTDRAKEWRRKVSLFASLLGLQDMAGLYCKLGPNWAYRYMDMIFEVDALLAKAKNTVPIVKDGHLIDARTGETLF